MMISKERMKTFLKGMSPDLMDNIILLCGGMVYDCHRMLRDEAGITRKAMEASDMLAFLNVNTQDTEDYPIPRRKKIRNADEILNVLSSI